MTSRKWALDRCNRPGGANLSSGQCRHFLTKQTEIKIARLVIHPPITFDISKTRQTRESSVRYVLAHLHIGLFASFPTITLQCSNFREIASFKIKILKPSVWLFRCSDAQCCWKLVTKNCGLTHTHTQDKYSNPRACVPRVNNLIDYCKGHTNTIKYRRHQWTN